MRNASIRCKFLVSLPEVLLPRASPSASGGLMNHEANNDRSFASILGETRDDIKQFFATRISLLGAELGEKLKVIGRTAPLAVLALVLLGTGYLMFTLSVVGLVRALLPATRFGWCLAFLAVAVLWTIAGGIAAW